MKRVLSYWIFGSVLLLLAGVQQYIPARGALGASVTRALGLFDISVGLVVLVFAFLLRRIAARAEKRKRGRVDA